MATQTATITLVEAAKRGDDSAFEHLLAPLLDPAYRLACVMLQDRPLAEDVVQEAAIKAWRKLSQLREGAQVRSWFLAIVANECRSARRSRGRAVRTVPEDPVEPAPDERALAGLELRQAVQAMNADKRLILVLHWYLDVPVPEIAAIERISVHAAESRLTRATQELRSRLEAGRGKR
jgi:RNA polymerase sigma-70 factor, ECF subfamily